MKTSHGKFVFSNQRFVRQTGEKRLNWLEYTQQFREGYESERLRSRCCYYANRMSDHEMARLLKDETGVILLSGQRIHDIVEEEARRLSAAKATQARAVLETGAVLPSINQEVAVYDGQTEEVLLFDDGAFRSKSKRNTGRHPLRSLLRPLMPGRNRNMSGNRGQRR